MITLVNVSKTHQLGEVVIPVLKSVSLKIQAGEFVSIMGPSGSGKSSLLNIIGCLDTVDTGIYRLNGKRVDLYTEDELAAVRLSLLGFVFQSFNLIPRFNALRNVELPMVYANVIPQLRMQRAQNALRIVGLENRLDHTPVQLSGGQQQRVAIARALVNDPKILIADEPTGALDTQTGHEIMQLFQALHEQGKTVVIVTHEAEIAAYAKRIVYLKDGQIFRDERK
jgi:putative ABC transport system ATP-binding protein